MKYVCSQKSSKVRLSKAKVKQLINLQLTQLALRAKSKKSVQRATEGREGTKEGGVRRKKPLLMVRAAHLTVVKFSARK